jgi:hypothetical protein
MSDGTCSKLLVGNALGLTGTLISALLVVSKPVYIGNSYLFRGWGE